jgi:hypothetical protein
VKSSSETIQKKMKVTSSVPQSLLWCRIFINHCRPNVPPYLTYAGDKSSLKGLRIKQITLKLSNTQDKQCTYNVTLKRVRATILQWKSNVYYITCVCICSLMYPACNAHAPYYRLWPAPLYNIFSTLCHKRQHFRENVIEHKMCVSSFPIAFVWNIFHSKKNWVDMIESV